ncbi:MAG: cytochrome C [Sulfurimonas sp.]|nr:MAG: cytochrome C [Sulfurimonas sp.]
MKKILLSIITLSSFIFASDYKTAGVKPVDNQDYIKECASCHFAYQPGLLPQRSWKKLMGNLQNHFDTDASLEKPDRVLLLKYLVNNASDTINAYKRSRKIDRSISKNKSPLAVTQTPYFKHEHREIAQRFIQQKEVRSLSNCMTCHTKADKGYYGERDINIPNYGRWDDD